MSDIIKMAEVDFVTGDDGFVVYWPSQEGPQGAWTAANLRTLADELDRRNDAWQKNLDSYFNEHRHFEQHRKGDQQTDIPFSI